MIARAREHVRCPVVVLVAGLLAALALAHPATTFARTALDQETPAASATIRVDSLMNEPPVPHPQGTAAPPSATSPVSDASDDSKALPFAHHQVPMTYPSLGVGIGVAGYVSNFRGVEQIFHAIEDSYAAEGYTLTFAKDVSPGPMMLYAITYRINRSLELAAQVGRTMNKNDDLTLGGGLVSGRYPLPTAPNASFFGRLGAGAYGFSFHRSYGARISPVDGSGGYSVLDDITLEGGGRYWTTAGGVTIRAGTEGVFEASIQYVGMPDVVVESQRAGRISMNMSGVILGASLAFLFLRP